MKTTDELPPAPRHTILNVNEEKRTGTCKHCGEVRLHRSGQNRWRCSNTNSKGLQPVRTKARYEHFISNINEEKRTGTCACCGEVGIYRNGFFKDGSIKWKCKNPSYSRSLEFNKLNSRTHPDSIHGFWTVSNAHKYGGITPDQVKEKFEKQDGKCSICKEPLDHTYHTDHCHTTMAFRGLLCKFCNHGIGLFRDSPTRLQAATQYLLNAHSESNILAPD